MRVVLADDQALVRAGFRLILETAGMQIVGEASTGREALKVVREQHPDVVLMDIRMPDLDGIEATRRITESKSLTRVLVLTTFDLDQYVYEAMKAGASGFLLKDAPREQLIAAVHIVSGSEALLSPAITRRLIEQFLRRPAPSHGTPEQLSELSPRELDVLRLIARGLSNAETAQHLILGDATIKTHVARILQKLGLRDRTQAVVLAYESGLIAPGETNGS